MSTELFTLIEMFNSKILQLEDAFYKFRRILPEDGLITSGDACKYLECKRTKLAKLAKIHPIKDESGKYKIDELRKIKPLKNTRL
jgi:hypothetical protein